MASVSLVLRQVHGLLARQASRFEHRILLAWMWYVAALVVVPTRRTTLRMGRLVPGCPTDRFGIGRVLNNSGLAARELLKLLGHRRLAKALAHKPQRRLWVLLDTTNLHRYGKHMEAAFRFKDNTTRGYIVGHRVVVCIAVVGKTIVPLGSRLFVREADARKLGVKYKSQIDLAQELVEALPSFDGVRVDVVADGFFFCAQLVRRCRELGYHFTSRARTNQKVTGPGAGRPGPLGEKMKKAFARRQARPVTATVRERKRTFLTVQRQHNFRRMGPINVVYSRERYKRRDPVALVTTDLKATAREVIEAIGVRWAIEMFFRTCKWDLGMGHYQGRHWEGVDQHLQLVLVAHLLLSHAGDTTRPAVGKPIKGETLSGLRLLKAGRGLLHDALVSDLLRGTRTRRQAEEALRNTFRLERAA